MAQAIIWYLIMGIIVTNVDFIGTYFYDRERLYKLYSDNIVEMILAYITAFFLGTIMWPMIAFAIIASFIGNR